MLWISNWILISKFLYTYVKSTFYIQRLPFAAQNLFTKFYSVIEILCALCILKVRSTHCRDNKTYVFVDKNGKEKSFYKGIISNFRLTDNMFYYFDNKHTIGTDLKQN